MRSRSRRHLVVLCHFLLGEENVRHFFGVLLRFHHADAVVLQERLLMQGNYIMLNMSNKKYTYISYIYSAYTHLRIQCFWSSPPKNCRRRRTCRRLDLWNPCCPRGPESRQPHDVCPKPTASSVCESFCQGLLVLTLRCLLLQAWGKRLQETWATLAALHEALRKA